MNRGSNKTSVKLYGKGEWQGVRGNALIANLQWGWMHRGRKSTPTPPMSDDSTSRPTACRARIGMSGIKQYNDRFHTVGSVTLYKPDTFHGNHEFKVGFDHYKHNAYGYWDPVATGQLHAVYQRRGTVPVRGD